jgi:tetratricopeptide (TPR) repeat protein
MPINILKLFFIALFLTAAASSADQLYTKNKKANQLYKKAEYGDALKMYDDLSVEAPAEPKLKMNKAAAHYQMGDFDKAEEALNAASSGLKDKKALADLYYNLGNTKYMQGEKLSAQGKQEAMDKYKEALENYIKALDMKPRDKDAKWNLQLTSAKIKEMQNQQQNKKDDKKNDKNKDDKKNQQNDKDQKNNDKKKDQKQDQNKDQQNKDNKQDKKDQDKNKQDQNSQNDKNQQDQQKPEPTPAQQKKEDMKKDEAKKLLEIYSDDEHDLNKKPEKMGIAGQKKSDKDW